MAYTEKEIKRLHELISGIEAGKEHKYAAPTYKDIPQIKQIMQIVGDRLATEGDAEAQTLKDSIAVLTYLADGYKGLGRMGICADILLAVLKLSRELYLRFGEMGSESESVLYDALRARNFYVDDDCEDIAQVCFGFMDRAAVSRALDGIKRGRRSLKHDPVEMSADYLAVIDEVERRVEENRTLYGHGSCYEVWSLKKQYLLEYGIVWHTPSELNPRVHFD